MSNKDRVLRLLSEVPDNHNKLLTVVSILQSIKDDEVETIEPDDFDLQMIENAQRVNDGSTISFDNLMKEYGITYDDLQD